MTRSIRSAVTPAGLGLMATISLLVQISAQTPWGNSHQPAEGDFSPRYAVIDLGTNRTPVAFNNAGSAVLRIGSTSQYAYWTNGSNINIVGLTAIVGINNSGQVVGTVSTNAIAMSGTDSRGTFQEDFWPAYMWTATGGGTVTHLPVPGSQFVKGTIHGLNATPHALSEGGPLSGDNYLTEAPTGIADDGTVYGRIYERFGPPEGAGIVVANIGAKLTSTITASPTGYWLWKDGWYEAGESAEVYQGGANFYPAPGGVAANGRTFGYQVTVGTGDHFVDTEHSYWIYGNQISTANSSNVLSPGAYVAYDGTDYYTLSGGVPSTIAGNGDILGYASTNVVLWTNYASSPAILTNAIIGSMNNQHQIVSGSSYWETNQLFNLNGMISGTNWTGISGNYINDGGAIVGTATYTGTNYPTGSHGVLLCPLEQDLVNRDDLTKKWTDKVVKSGLDTVYAGTTAGDMVEWKINGGTGWLSGTYTWTATDSNSNVITGPTGVGVDHWQICDTGGNDPASKTTLDWNPDTYKIKCVISFSGGGTIPIEFSQKVGWRTEDYVVIGQIVNTTTFASSGPATSTDSTLFRAAITTDCAGVFTLGAGLSGGLSSLASTALPDSAFGFIEFGSWGAWPHALTSQGPLWYAGAVTEGDRYWMMENALNASVDTPTVTSPMTAAQMTSAQSAGQYRIFQHYQTRFTLTPTGTIDTTSFHDIHNDGITGQTKFNVPAHTFSPAWDNPDIPLFTVAAQTNPIDSVLNQGHTQTSSDSKKHSSYASGRVGSDGQNVNYHVMGQDVPWIYSEIICSVATDHTVTSSIKMSVNKTWLDSGGLSGDTNFNNLNIYKATTSTDVGGAVSVNYVSQHDSPLLMEGQLQSFILSVPLGTWPTPPTTPSVQ